MQRLDNDQLRYLSAQDKERYSALEDMFHSSGWPLLVELCQKQAVEAHNRAANATSWEQNRLNLGLRMAYEHLATIETATYNEFVEIAESARQRELEANLADEIEHQS
jgi:hypothetical protein